MTQRASRVSVSTDELVTTNLPLVGHIVRETMGRVPSHVDRDDLTSAGLIALVQAAQAFEQERGVPFGRYAATRIRGALLDELRSVDWATRSVRRRARELDATRAQLASTLGRPATVEEVASAVGLSADEVASNDDDLARAQVLALDAGDGATLGDSLISADPSPEAAIEHRERLAYLAVAIAELPERLRIVVQEYFLAERPMAEIAERLEVSESRISQLRAEALVLLRDALNTHLDPDLVPAARRPGGCADRRREAYFAAVGERHAASVGRSPSLPAGPGVVPSVRTAPSRVGVNVSA